MNTNHRVQRAVHIALGVASGALLASNVPTAFAQDTISEVVVTGSRISRPDLDSASPVTIISYEQISAAGVTDIGDLIQSIPSMSGSPIGTTTNNGGNGSVQIDLRGMGVNRTVTLVNGKRTVDGGDYQTIPANMIERVEILKDGGASVYGADAVAGVVNIITRTDFDGLELTAQTADFQNMDSGMQNSVGLLGGKTFEGGHFTFGAEYVNQEQAYQSDAPWDFFQNSYYIYPEGCERQVAAPYTGYPDGGCYPVGSSRIPEGRLNSGQLAQRFYSAASGGGARLFDYFNGVFNRVNGLSNGAPEPTFDPLFAVPTFNTPNILMNEDGSGLVPYDNRTYNYAPVNYIQTPYERTNVYLDGKFAVTDSVNFSGSIRGNFRQSAQELAPQPYDSASDPGYAGAYTRIDPVTGLPLREFATVNAAGDPIIAYTADQTIGSVVAPTAYNGISPDNYYNPLGYPVLNARRRIQEQTRRFTQDIQQYQVNLGLDGSAGENLKWDVYYNFGQRSEVFHDFGQWSGPRLANALGPSADLNDDGTPECYGNINDPSTLIVGCVPANLFGGPLSMTQDQLDYLTVDLTDTVLTTQQEAQASLTGDWFDLPGGKLGWAVGFGYGNTDFEYQPDSAKQNDSVTGNTGAGTKGSLVSNSVFGEILAPLYDNGTQSLDMRASVRWDDYDAFDAETTYAFGVEFSVMKDLKLRATYGTVFRVPTINNLFGGIVDSFPTYTDPCIPTAAAPLLAPGCAQVGIQTDIQLLAKVGGNPLLQPETGDTLTAGVVWSPQLGNGDLSVTVDYWQIAIQDGISSLGVQFILDDCYINQNSASCALVFRNPDYSIDHVNDGSLNVSDQGAKGVDTEARYAWDTSVGKFEAAVLWAHLLERTKTPFAGAPEEDLSGRYTDPTAEDGGAYAADKANFSFKWFWKDLLVGYTAEYISSLDADTFCNCGAGNRPDGSYIQKIDSQLYHDLFAQYQLEMGTKIAVGITNLTDEDPPYIETGFNATTDPSTYRMFGRGYYLRLSHKFQ
jgi:iron complex outermembrane receptor protein